MKRHPHQYTNLVPRLGGFHIAENFMGSIGFFMKYGGIEDILSESGVCKRCITNKVIAGKDYYKMVRCHALVSKTMIGLAWDPLKSRCYPTDATRLSSNNGQLHWCEGNVSRNCPCLELIYRITRDHIEILADVHWYVRHPEAIHKGRESGKVGTTSQGSSKYAPLHRCL